MSRNTSNRYSLEEDAKLAKALLNKMEFLEQKVYNTPVASRVFHNTPDQVELMVCRNEMKELTNGSIGENFKIHNGYLYA